MKILLSPGLPNEPIKWDEVDFRLAEFVNNIDDMQLIQVDIIFSTYWTIILELVLLFLKK